MFKNLTIAVDFDGTIVENRYPKIGKPILFALETLTKLQEEGHQIILWTYRTGPKLEEAVKYCSLMGLKFYAVNKSYPEEVFDSAISRKIQADYFIDDRNIGGLMGWGEIYQLLSEKAEQRQDKKNSKNKKQRKGVLHYLKFKL